MQMDYSFRYLIDGRQAKSYFLFANGSYVYSIFIAFNSASIDHNLLIDSIQIPY